MNIFIAKKIFSSLFCLVVFIVASDAQSIHSWEVFSVSFKSAKAYANPYNEIPSIKGNDLLKVTFTGTGGDALNRNITIIGFWNGGSEWRVNFSSPFTGSWKYTSVSTDRSMNGKKGTIEVVAWTEEEKMANPARRGLIRVKKDGETAGHYFEYSDGKPFLWIGDTWWNWTKKSIRFDTFKQMVDNRSEKGFNIGQLFVPGNGWGRESLLDRKSVV
jgi:hypothetical protein